MASRKVFAIRASSVLTTSEVAGTTFPLAKASDDKSTTIDIRLTIGSLDAATLFFYVSTDDSTYVPWVIKGGETSLTLDADANIALDVNAPGWTYFRVSAIGYGTATNSLLVVNARYI